VSDVTAIVIVKPVLYLFVVKANVPLVFQIMIVLLSIMVENVTP